MKYFFKLYILENKKLVEWLDSLNKHIFKIRAKYFKLIFSGKEIKKNYSSSRFLLKFTDYPLISASIFALLLQYLDNVLFNQLPQVSDLNSYTENYTSFLAAISGIGSVFIGLYYTAVSTVSGTTYAQVPNNIRDLIAHDRQGNIYMAIVSFTTILGIILILLLLLGFEPNIIALPIMTLLAAVAVASFIVMGKRLFRFFDPTVLASNVLIELDEWVQMIQPGGHRWHDQNYQTHAHNMALQLAESIEIISNISIENKHLRGTPLVTLSRNIISFLSRYETAKSRIPLKSKWYPIKYVHKDWYKSDQTTVEIAYKTATRLHPDTTNDRDWIEKKLFPLIVSSLKASIQDNNFSNTYELIGLIRYYLTLLSENSKVIYAFDFMKEVTDATIPLLKPNSENDRPLLEHLSILESLSSLKIDIVIGYLKYCEVQKSERLEEKLQNLIWINKASIYNQGFQEHLLGQLEWLQERINLEYQIEEKVITPVWYSLDVIRLKESEQIFSNLKQLFIKSFSYNDELIETVKEFNNPYFSGAIFSVEWEYLFKLFRFHNEFLKTANSINSNIKLKDLKWPAFDKKNFLKDCEGRRLKILKSISQTSISLNLLDRPVDFPDYGGQFLHTTGESIISLLIENNSEALKDIFPIYFWGCLNKFESLKGDGKPEVLLNEYSLGLACAPIMEILDISGYFYLMSEYFDNKALSDIVREAWNNYLKEAGDKQRTFLAAVVAFVEGSFSLGHRSWGRYTWSQLITAELSSLPHVVIPSEDIFRELQSVKHDSALVRIYSRHDMGRSRDGIDIFINKYLSPDVDGKNLDFGRSRDNLEKELQREEELYNTFLQRNGETDED